MLRAYFKERKTIIRLLGLFLKLIDIHILNRLLKLHFFPDYIATVRILNSLHLFL